MYEVYIEKVFVINLVLNIFILILTAKTLKLVVPNLRILIGGVIGAFGYCLILPLPVTYSVKVLIGLIPVSILMAKITYKTVGFKNVLRQTGYLFIYAFLTGAIMLFILQHVPLAGLYTDKVLVILILGYVVFVAVDFFHKWNRQHQENVFTKVSIPCGLEEITVTALIDTGNGLIEPISKKPVTILEETVWELIEPLKKPEKTKVIPYHSIESTKGIMTGYEIETIYIEHSGQRIKCENVIIAQAPGRISASGEYQMILNPQMLEGSNERIKGVLHKKIKGEKKWSLKLQSRGN